MFWSKLFLAFGALGGMLAVVMGALSAHILSDDIPARKTELLHIAVQYQFHNALCLLILGIFCLRHTPPTKTLIASGSFLFSGMILFCGSLYAESFLSLSLPTILIPLGGLFLVLGWGGLFVAVLASGKLNN